MLVSELFYTFFIMKIYFTTVIFQWKNALFGLYGEKKFAE